MSGTTKPEPILVNIPAEIGATRYNGGWVKTVTGIDKSKNNGYSLLGDFVGDGLQPLQPGLYLVCDIGGSRKNQTKNYTLCELHTDGSVEELTEVQGTSGYDRNRSGHDWAVRLWGDIDEYFKRQSEANEAAMLAAAVPAEAAVLTLLYAMPVRSTDPAVAIGLKQMIHDYLAAHGETLTADDIAMTIGLPEATTYPLPGYPSANDD